MQVWERVPLQSVSPASSSQVYYLWRRKDLQGNEGVFANLLRNNKVNSEPIQIFASLAADTLACCYNTILERKHLLDF